MARAKDRAGTSDRIHLGVAGAGSYDGSGTAEDFAGEIILCPACGAPATWTDGEETMGRGYRCPRGHLTDPGPERGPQP